MSQNVQRILVDNPTNLPLASVDDFKLFQGDLKMPITDQALQAMKSSILEHHVFIGKAVAKFNGELLTEDGHQTLQVLQSLRDDDGYTASRVITYREENGNMVEDGYHDYDDIVIPYQLVVPQGKSDDERRKDAAAKVAIINSQYAEINPQTTFFKSLGFNHDDIANLMNITQIPELSFTNFGFLTTTFGTFGEDGGFESPDDEHDEEPYSRKIQAPIYTVTGEKPEVSTLVNTEKTDAMIQQIHASNLPVQEKQFLIRAAYRHDVFDYGKIAEYYAHGDQPLQEHFEHSALVIIDIGQAIEQGLVVLSKVFEEQYGKDITTVEDIDVSIDPEELIASEGPSYDT